MPRLLRDPNNLKAFSDYQRQLWDPLSVPMGLDMNDIGYARGGSGIDSVRPGDYHSSFLDIKAAKAVDMGEWHFHVFGETVGLFALDVWQGSAGLQVKVETSTSDTFCCWVWLLIRCVYYSSVKLGPDSSH